MSKRAYIYARYSPRRNTEKCESIEVQVEKCMEHCRRQGYTCAGVFSDRALSGKDTNRPDLWRVLDTLKRGDVLVVYKYDRLARDCYDAFYIERFATKKGATMESASGEPSINDSLTAQDKLMVNMLRAFAEYERAVIVERTKTAMLRHQANGRRMGLIAPYGFKVDPNDPKRLIPDEREQEIVAEIVRLADAGTGFRAIARHLDSLGIEPRSGGTWDHSTIRQIVKRVGN